ncbi:MAG: [protein-PII] uridylyltransferase, partial [Acidimicrobiales bacterium]
LAAVAGVLALSGTTIRSAVLRTELPDPSANALLELEVAPAFDVLPKWADVEADLRAVLEGRMALAERLEAYERPYLRYRRTIAAEAPPVRVTVAEEASQRSTVLEVRAPDTGPVLYHLATAIADAGLLTQAALVSTLGAEVVDVLYVQDAEGRKLVPGSHEEGELVEAVLAALDLSKLTGGEGPG